MPVLAEVMEPISTGLRKITATGRRLAHARTPVLLAAIGHALAFSTWRSLACDLGSGMKLWPI